MKQFIICLCLVIGLLIIIDDKVVIPKDSIRLRIIANSNSKVDQEIKYSVKAAVESDLAKILSNNFSLNSTRDSLLFNLGNIKTTVNRVLKDNNYPLKYNVNYGINYFPDKEYKGVKYNSGNYESLVITIGSGLGNNWWCVLFPPFCFVEGQESDNVEYKIFAKELIDKYF